MGNFDELTPEQREQVKKRRDQGFGFLQKLCLGQLGLATISIIAGIVQIAYSAENPTFPYIVATPILSGVFVAIGATFGFLATKQGQNKDDVTDKVKGYVICHYVLNVLCITVCMGSGVIGVLGVIFCQSSDPDIKNCDHNRDQLLALSVVSVIVGLLLAIFCIMGTCYFCCYARTLGFKSKGEYRMNRQMRRMQREIDQLRAAQGQAVPPPAYSETLDDGQGHRNYGFSAPGKIALVDLSKR